MVGNYLYGKVDALKTVLDCFVCGKEKVVCLTVSYSLLEQDRGLDFVQFAAFSLYRLIKLNIKIIDLLFLIFIRAFSK